MVPNQAADLSGSSEDGDVLNLADDEGWDDVEPDLEPVRILCLICDTVFDRIQSMLQHCKDSHGLDIVSIRQQLGEHAQASH